jgi:sugar phosphate isomerase/epimerase
MRLRLAAITDEFSPDLETALRAMAGVGMRGAELRVIGGRNVIDLDNAQIDRARALVEQHGLEVIGIASPVLKCVLPDAPALDASFQQDMFGVDRPFADQPKLAARAFEIAERTGARLIRVFSYWRTVDPPACRDRIAAALHELAENASRRGLIVALENEHACNIGTGAEAGALIRTIDHPALKLLWDPANALVAGEIPYPDGYRALPADRIVHVHAKDCVVQNHKPAWGPVGERDVDWRGQIDALLRDGYAGWISLETHWTGPHGDKLEASTICGRNLSALLS